MTVLRKIVFWCHLVVGGFVATIVVIMSATGVLLTYQKQMTLWADTRGLDGSAPHAAASRLPMDSLLRGVQRISRATPTSVIVRFEANAPVEIVHGPTGRAFVNAYTGAVLGEGSTTMRGFFRVVTAWHRTVGATGEHRARGKAITGAANLGFLFIVLSGLYLWWPRNWTRRAVASVTTFRRGLAGKARDFNWHNTIGFWSFAPLAIIVFSGSVISYPWMSALVYRAMGEKAPAPAATAAAPASRPTDSEPAMSLDGLDAMLAQAATRMPDWRAITFAPPKENATTVVFTLDRGSGGQPQNRGTVTLNRATGDETKWEPFASQSAGRRARSFLRFAHTGEYFGVTGQTIAGLVTLGSLVLVWTGLALALRRLAAWRGRRARNETAEPVPPVAPVWSDERDAVA